MTAGALPLDGTWPFHTLPRARWFLVGMHVPFVVFTAARAVHGLGVVPATAPYALALVVAVGALQLRHSLALAEGARPRLWRWTLLLLILLCYVPLLWWGQRWLIMEWFAIASLALLLPSRYLLLATVPAWLSATVEALVLFDGTPVQAAWVFVYVATVLLMGGGGLYGAVRLVRTVHELHAARSELADLAVAAERSRIARDLHDLLGQSLSAVSLKGDLAIRLLDRADRAGAAVVLDSITETARTALRDVRAVTSDRAPRSLAMELEGARGLLEAAGVRVDVVVPSPAETGALDELLAWAVREAATNVLRHSPNATRCTFVLRAGASGTVLRITNDGTSPPAGQNGTGLVGLHARAAAVGGRAQGRERDDGTFELLVEIPAGGPT